jgi:hypothetical protein
VIKKILVFLLLCGRFFEKIPKNLKNFEIPWQPMANYGQLWPSCVFTLKTALLKNQIKTLARIARDC